MGRGRANARGAEQPLVYRGERMVRARSVPSSRQQSGVKWRASGSAGRESVVGQSLCYGVQQLGVSPLARASRSEEHTSELQSLMRISYAVFCLKKKQKQDTYQHH